MLLRVLLLCVVYGLVEKCDGVVTVFVVIVISCGGVRRFRDTLIVVVCTVLLKSTVRNFQNVYKFKTFVNETHKNVFAALKSCTYHTSSCCKSSSMCPFQKTSTYI